MNYYYLVGGYAESPENPTLLAPAELISMGPYQCAAEAACAGVVKDYIAHYKGRINNGRYFGFKLSLLEIDPHTHACVIIHIAEQYKDPVIKTVVNTSPQKAKKFQGYTLDASLFIADPEQLPTFSIEGTTTSSSNSIGTFDESPPQF